MPAFAIDAVLDPMRLAAPYRTRRRLHIPGILAPEGAERIHAHLQARDDWRHVFNADDNVYELDQQARRDIDPDQLALLDTQVDAGAVAGFQYRYETIRVADNGPAGTLLEAFAAFLCSDGMIAWFRAVTGLNGIGFADAQATRYRPGDFLTGHDDAVGGKDRLAAYIFNFTPRWRPEWGGLLMFHGDDGHIDEALVPSWNALNIFTVPQMHSVSRVVPAIPVPRYSITGWLRGTPGR